MKNPESTERIEQAIFFIRGQKVILDADLAPHLRRSNFMFQLTMEEADGLGRSRSQFATLKRGQNIKYLPYAFTEHGAIMAANVLNNRLVILSKAKDLASPLRGRGQGEGKRVLPPHSPV